MKKTLIVLCTVFLAGCITVPTKREFPKVPAEIKEACPDLSLVDEKETKLSSVISVISENYGKYHDCKIKIDLWIEWYDKQKKIFESVK